MSIKRKPPAGLTVYGKRAKRRQIPHTTTDTLSSMFFPPTEAIDQSQQPPPLPPNKPNFRMTVDPSEQDVQNLIEFCEGAGSPISKADAIRYLKVKNNDIQNACEAWIFQEDISSQEKALSWDEGAWSQGKEGPGAGGDNGMTDPHLRPLLSSSAPTRNNSPARSNMQPSSKQQEDEDLARAMQMSQGNDWSQQESGVVTSGGQETQFGPANRPDYNPRDWAMVPAGASTTGEVVPDAEAAERIRKSGQPRMLKQIPGNGEYLANLLTILVNMYGVREALLMRDIVKSDYGQDPEWWKGTLISMPKIVALSDASRAHGDASGAHGDADQYDDLLAEVQRLMAFLSATERSYGSAGALLQTEAIKSSSTGSVRSNTMLELFMQTWAVAAVAKGEDSDLASLFTTTVGTNASEGMADTDMTLIDIAAEAGADPKKPQDLLELLDGLLWDTSESEVTSDNYIEQPAAVLVMRLRQRYPSKTDSMLKVSAPSEFYVDKYMKEHIESTRHTRAEMAKGRKKVEKIEQIEKKLRTWRNPADGKEMDASKLTGHTLKYFQAENKLSKESPPPYSDIVSKLEAIIANIDEKLATLSEEKEKTLASVAAMSRAPPPGLGPGDQQYRYILRGIATKPNVTYVLAHDTDDEHVEDDNTEEFDDSDDNTWPGMRWWRLEYEVAPSGLSASVRKTRIGDYDVLRAVELEHDKALLVYGNIDMNAPPEPDDIEGLPEPLARFVQRDNEIFAEERKAEQSKPPAYQQSFDLTGGDDGDSGNRRHEKRASMDSTRAEGGQSNPPSPPGYGDGGFERHHSFGLGPDLKGPGASYGTGYDGAGEDVVDDAPVAEIVLPDADGEEDEEGSGVQMVEKAHPSLVPGLGVGGVKSGSRSAESGSDVEMEEVKR